MAKKKSGRKKKKISHLDLLIRIMASIVAFSIFVMCMQGRKLIREEIEKEEKAYIRQITTYKDLKMEHYNDKPDRILFKTKNSKKFVSFKSSNRNFKHLLDLAEDEIQKAKKGDPTYSCFSYDNIEEIRNDKGSSYIILDFNKEEKLDDNLTLAFKIEDEESLLYKNLKYYSFLKFKTKGEDVSFERKYERIPETDFKIIKTAEDFKNIKVDQNYKLGNDIDFEGSPVIFDFAYKGILDGNGFSLTNITIKEEDIEKLDKTDYRGIFKQNEGIIRNLKIENINIDLKNSKGNCYNFGILVGMNLGAIKNCTLVSGTAKNEQGRIAGIAYYSSFGEIKDCVNKIEINNATAGIVADARITDIENCKNEATLKGGTVNGIAGTCSGMIINCSNTGNIEAESQGFGICKNIKEGIKDCSNSGNVTSQNGLASGIVGFASKSIVNCVNSGNITGFSEVAGVALIAGENKPILIDNCRNSGTIQLNYKNSEITYSCIAGIVCEMNYGEIKRCINEGNLLKDLNLNVSSGDIIARKTSEVKCDINLDTVDTVEVDSIIRGTSVE